MTHAPSSRRPAEEEIALEKRRLRQQMRAALGGIADEDAAARSAKACGHLVHAPFIYAARVILAFWPMVPVGEVGRTAREVDIRPVLVRCMELGKRLCIPRMNWETGEMMAVGVTDLEKDLVPAGPAGGKAPMAGLLREPRKGLPAVDVSELDVILVPGLAFDHAGHRLGRGAGFYDRFLSDEVLIRGGAPTCGIAFALSLVPEVPHRSTDVPVDAVATENGIHGVEA